MVTLKGEKMTYQFRIMTQEEAEYIAFNWHYNGEYSFYDMESDKADLEKFLNPETRANSMLTVSNNNELIGFFSVYKVADKTLDIGLGMKPDFTGRGKGLEFLKEGLDYILSEYNPDKITLSVATFNQRAIKVYSKMGFRDIDTYIQDTNGSTYKFLRMEYNC